MSGKLEEAEGTDFNQTTRESETWRGYIEKLKRGRNVRSRGVYRRQRSVLPRTRPYKVPWGGSSMHGKVGDSVRLETGEKLGERTL